MTVAQVLKQLTDLQNNKNMRNIYKIFAVAFITLAATSCDRDQGEYPYLDGRANILSFSGSTGTLLVENGGANLFSVAVGATQVVQSGTFGVTIDPSSTAVLGNDYFITNGTDDGSGMLIFDFTAGNLIQGIDLFADFSSSSPDGKTVVMNLVSLDNNFEVSSSGSQFTLTLLQYCPLEADFTGDYTLATTATGIFGSTVFVNGTVTISEGATPTDRTFSSPTYPEFGAFPSMDFNFSLLCGNVQVPTGQATGVGCGSSTTLGPAANVGSYDPSDDSSFTIIITDDEGGSCGSPFEAAFLLTKI